MRTEEIIYFCSAYLIMLDYDQILEQVIREYNEKEGKATKQKLKNELVYISNMPQIEREKLLENVILETSYFDIGTEEFEAILKQLDRNIII